MAYLLSSDLIDPARCGQLFAEAIACTERSGDQFMNYLLHNNAGVHALHAGDIRRRPGSSGTGGTGPAGDRASSHHVSVNLGWVLRQEGDPDGARSMFEAGLRMSRRNGDPSGLAYASLGLACLAADRGDWHRAGELHGAAQAFLDRTGERWQEPEARYRQDSLDHVRARLGEEQFDRAYAKGMTLSLDEALDLALGRAAPA